MTRRMPQPYSTPEVQQHHTLKASIIPAHYYVIDDPKQVFGARYRIPQSSHTIAEATSTRSQHNEHLTPPRNPHPFPIHHQFSKTTPYQLTAYPIRSVPLSSFPCLADARSQPVAHSQARIHLFSSFRHDAFRSSSVRTTTIYIEKSGFL